MTKYVLEFFKKGERKPYEVSYGRLNNGYHPVYCNERSCFDGRLDKPWRTKVRYASDRHLAAVTWIDKDGKKRLRWFKA